MFKLNDANNFYNGQLVEIVENHAQIGVVLVRLVEKPNITFATKNANLVEHRPACEACNYPQTLDQTNGFECHNPACYANPHSPNTKADFDAANEKRESEEIERNRLNDLRRQSFELN